MDSNDLANNLPICHRKRRSTIMTSHVIDDGYIMTSDDQLRMEEPLSATATEGPSVSLLPPNDNFRGTVGFAVSSITRKLTLRSFQFKIRRRRTFVRPEKSCSPPPTPTWRICGIVWISRSFPERRNAKVLRTPRQGNEAMSDDDASMTRTLRSGTSRRTRKSRSC